ncbi:MAG: tRNA (adenosine(37)-N6)-threonylcarbamoyltransferase complex transferase subunit TsaD [Zetaproteobacteria bacterium]|nr:tRNA (adenosine(37)-N6)-threonylcarbamoyltransferase complex transferase subunit TsaD [Zetaproteobacteria bacterium]
MIILGIESSCDETAVALIKGKPHAKIAILSETIASQIQIHAPFGGVVPEVASREHLAILPRLTKETLRKANISLEMIDAIAVTAGPGLMGCLLVGVSFARGLGEAANIPVIPVHHMVGHLLAPGIHENLPPFPFITLLVSGGHTMLVRVNGIDDYQIIGQTIDDAAGECFDKTARLLGLPYPGGPSIAKAAHDGDAKAFKLPRPLLQKKNLDFSFSGLKTAVMYALKDQDLSNPQTIANIAASTQSAIVDVLVQKSLRACKQEKIKNLVIAGGVAANHLLRTQLDGNSQNIAIHYPDIQYCTDNATMIAHAALYLKQNDTTDWDVNPRWKFTDNL